MPSASFRSSGFGAKDVFGVPEPLARDSVPSLPYPVDALGPIMAGMARALQAATEAPLAICGSSILASGAVAVQPHADVEVDGRVFPVSLYVATIAESGERKSTVDNHAQRAHRAYEKLQWERFGQDSTDYDIRSAIYRTEREAILKNKKLSRHEKESKLKDLVAPERVRRPYLLIEDTTIEALLKHLRDDRPSVGLYSSEGGMFLYGHSMQRENQLHTITALSQLWDGKAVQRNTVNDFENTVPLYGRRLSAHLMLQPRMAMEILGNQQIQSQGLYSRFLICWPESRIGFRFGENTNRMDQSADAALFNSRITSILERELPLSTKHPGELVPRRLSLSAQAYGVWRQFNNTVERRMAPGGDLALLRAFSNKAAENAARIAGVLTLVEDIDAGEVPAETMRNAVDLTNFYVHETLRIFCQGTVSDELRQAQVLLDWINERELRYVYPSQAYQAGPRSFRTRDKAIAALKILEEHSYLLRLEEGTEVDGKARKVAWKVTEDMSEG